MADAAYLYDAVRTPFDRHGGALAGVRPDDLAAHVVRELTSESPQLDPSRIDEVVFGDANQPGEDNRGYGVAENCMGVGQGLAVVLHA